MKELEDENLNEVEEINENEELIELDEEEEFEVEGGATAGASCAEVAIAKNIDLHYKKEVTLDIQRIFPRIQSPFRCTHSNTAFFTINMKDRYNLSIKRTGLGPSTSTNLFQKIHVMFVEIRGGKKYRLTLNIKY